MSEETRKYEELIRNEFARMFPLCPTDLLPWYPTHIEAFLKKRIELEVERQTSDTFMHVFKVLSEAVIVKSHLCDMARLAVQKVKRGSAVAHSVMADIEVNLKRMESKDYEIPTKEQLREWLESVKQRIINTGVFE